MSSKSKSSLSATPTTKSSSAIPRVSKLTRGNSKSEPDSPSPLQNSRLPTDRSPKSVNSVHSKLSIDRSPKSVNSVNSKPAVARRSPSAPTPPEKQPIRVLKGSELQAQLNLAQQDLKKAKEQLALTEKEKAQAVNELKEAQKLAGEANEKLQEALVAQKRAEDSSEIEKFRAIELEQAGIEASQKKEDEWKEELESVKNQHALDAAALVSTTEELQRVKQELAMNCDAKNRALGHADDATKIAEIRAEKVELLSAEIVHLKAKLDSRHETEASENKNMMLKLNLEIDSLKQELKKAKGFEKSLSEREASIEKLNVELEAARMAESYARNLVEEWKHRVEDLENQVEEASRLERAASDSLSSVMKQLEGKNDSLQKAESEITSLTEKLGLLEMSIGRQKGDVVESERRLVLAKEEASAMAEMVESLKTELETVKEEKAQALTNEKLSASSVESLLEEKNRLIDELENSHAEEEKSKKAMESLASALHEVSVEGRETKEKLISIQAEHDNYETQIEDFKLVIEATNEKYEATLDDAKHKIDHLTYTIEQTKNKFSNSKAEWEQKELNLVDRVKNSEEQRSSLGKEIDRLLNLLKESETEASAAKEEGTQLKNNLKESESEVVFLKEVVGEAKGESMKLKEVLMDKENELKSTIRENNELRTRESTSLQRIEELSKLLEEASAKKQSEGISELTDSEKDYDMLPKVVEFSEENGHGGEEIPILGPPSHPIEEPKIENSQKDSNLASAEAVQKDRTKSGEVNGKLEEDENKQKEEEFKMWESCKIGDKDFSPERELEQESFEGELDSKVDEGESFDRINGSEKIENGESSPTKLQQQKKKKPLLKKFGSLLKRRSPSQHN